MSERNMGFGPAGVYAALQEIDPTGAPRLHGRLPTPRASDETRLTHIDWSLMMATWLHQPHGARHCCLFYYHRGEWHLHSFPRQATTVDNYLNTIIDPDLVEIILLVEEVAPGVGGPVNQRYELTYARQVP